MNLIGTILIVKEMPSQFLMTSLSFFHSFVLLNHFFFISTYMWSWWSVNVSLFFFATIAFFENRKKVYLLNPHFLWKLNGIRKDKYSHFLWKYGVRKNLYAQKFIPIRYLLSLNRFRICSNIFEFWHFKNSSIPTLQFIYYLINFISNFQLTSLLSNPVVLDVYFSKYGQCQKKEMHDFLFSKVKHKKIFWKRLIYSYYKDWFFNFLYQQFILFISETCKNCRPHTNKLPWRPKTVFASCELSLTELPNNCPPW